MLLLMVNTMQLVPFSGLEGWGGFLDGLGESAQVQYYGSTFYPHNSQDIYWFQNNYQPDNRKALRTTNGQGLTKTIALLEDFPVPDDFNRGFRYFYTNETIYIVDNWGYKTSFKKISTANGVIESLPVSIPTLKNLLRLRDLKIATIR